MRRLIIPLSPLRDFGDDGMSPGTYLTLFLLFTSTPNLPL